ncbi:hypothetical protein FDK38_000678 [Candidozyma auris]|nr:hypothetical protein FDK38_000678 [[Candida] auris]
MNFPPIGPTSVLQPYSIVNLPPLIIGGAVLNDIYTKDPTKLPIQDILSIAFSKGLNAIDTSPYYGRSEELIGKALKAITAEWPRESYYICTKAGRITDTTFDYSREHVRESVKNSLRLLNTDFLDLVYMHDVEFVETPEVYDALRELRVMKEEGLIKAFGFSGYPVKLLYEIAYKCAHDYVEDIGSVDAILSYSHGCIQNTALFKLYDDFINKCGIKKILNGSILSMSLLRSGKTHAFHPASVELKAKVDEVAQDLKETSNIELAEPATRFAMKRWLFQTQPQTYPPLKWNQRTSIVLGVSTVEELNSALKSYADVKEKDGAEDEKLFEEIIKKLGSHFNETWPSGLYSAT